VHDKLGHVVSRQRLDDLVSRETGTYRERVYPPLVTLGLFVEQVIHSDQACQDVVGRALSQRTALGLKDCSLNTGPYCKARQRLGLGLLQGMAREIAAQAEQGGETAWRWRGRSVKLIDGTTISMPDTAENQAAFPQNHEQAPGLGFPVARIVGVISLLSGCVLDWTVSACEGEGTSELMQLRQLLKGLSRGDVVIADRGYCSYFLLAMLGQQGVDCVVREHQRRKNDLRLATRLGDRDYVVTWHKPQRPRWMDEATYTTIPDTLRLREVKDGNWSIVTTLIDPGAVTAKEVVWLYRQRWQIELDFRSIKCAMQMDILRCKTPQMVEKEIAAHVLGYNLIRALMGAAAKTGMLLPRQLSLAAARRAVVTFQERLRHNPAANFDEAHEQLLRSIACRRIPDRPNRVEPRAVKRRPKPQRLLTVPRNIARQRLLEQRICA
jgi:hypothetical protein